jgi:hypothetical protein
MEESHKVEQLDLRRIVKILSLNYTLYFYYYRHPDYNALYYFTTLEISIVSQDNGWSQCHKAERLDLRRIMAMLFLAMQERGDNSNYSLTDSKRSRNDGLR